MLIGWVIGMILFSYIRSRFNLFSDEKYDLFIIGWPIAPFIGIVVGLALIIAWLMEWAIELGKRGRKQ